MKLSNLNLKKIPRTETELLKSLASHVSILESFLKKAFDEGCDEYYGEIAGKLRLLVCKTKSNHPLLLDMMAK